MYFGFFLFGSALSLFYSPLKMLYSSALFFYLCLVFIFSISKELRLIPLVFSGIILTHISYGLFFLKGLFSVKLKEEL